MLIVSYDKLEVDKLIQRYNQLQEQNQQQEGLKAKTSLYSSKTRKTEYCIPDVGTVVGYMAEVYINF